jgi:hypothetical protein
MFADKEYSNSFRPNLSHHCRHLLMNSLVRRGLARPLLVRQYATPVKEPNPQYGGYPELPDISHQYRAPLGWQDKLLRRNFGDTVGLSRVSLALS